VEPLGIVAIAFGIFVLAARAPLVFAPQATLAFSTVPLASNARVRAVTGRDDPGTAATVLSGVGWFLLGVGAPVLLLFPAFYRGLAGSILGLMSDSTDRAVLRGMGVLGTAVGLLFVIAGLRML
jgi:hypothetical protein